MTRRQVVQRGLPLAALIGAVAVAALPVDVAPLPVVLGAALVALALALYLTADSLLARWLRENVGKGHGPLHFFQSQSVRLMAVLLACGAGIGWLLGQRLRLSAGEREMLHAAILVCGGFALVVAAWELRPRARRKNTHPYATVREKTGIRSLANQVREAWDFQKVCGGRMLAPLLMLWAAALAVACFLAGGLAGLFYFLGNSGYQVGLYEADRWPWFLNLIVLAVVGLVGWVLALAQVSSFRLTQRVRRVGRVKPGVVWLDLGMSVEALMLLPTLVWVWVNALVLTGLLFVTVFVYAAAVERLGEPALCLAVAVALGFVLVWFGLVMPQAYAAALLTRRDCGWLRAFHVSVELLGLERGEGVAKAFLATVGFVSIAGIPFAAYLLLNSLEKQDLIVCLALNEKTMKEVQLALTEKEVFLSDALKKHFAALDAGRFLDALNGFQMYLHSHREDVDAMRGQALALLYMGHPKAREILERWESLAPESAEAKERLKELNAGEWKEGGARLEEARRRMTQPLGRGV